MTEVERSKITSLDKCNFNKIGKFYKEKSEANKNRTKEEKLVRVIMIKQNDSPVLIFRYNQ